MLGGAFLGELFRLALLDLIRNDLLLGGKMSTMLEQPNSISTSFLSCIDFESVCSQYHSFEQIDSMLIHQFDYQPEDIEMDDRKIIAYVSALITTRCALLCAIGLYGLFLILIMIICIHFNGRISTIHQSYGQ